MAINFKSRTEKLSLCSRCCSVAVLQFQNKLYESQKLTLYLYINIEVFLGYGNSFSRTATLQQPQQWEQSHCNATLWPSGQRSLLELCRAPAVVDEVNTAMLRAKIIAEKWKMSCEVFVNRNQKFLPLHCQIEEADRRSLRVKIAKVKSRNCAH